ncbi:MAG: metallophosphoesterase, partial [Verrucomicrobiota bacterium]|nr:metallophosphoesterase [Verrucomicrobiota bacterium]
IRSSAIEDIEHVVQLLRPMSDAGIPVYAVLGNHDRATAPLARSRATILRDALTSAGIRVLTDEAVRLASNKSDLWLVGLTSEKARQAARAAAFVQLPPNAARVVLMHNPERFEELPAGAAPLALAGHTHGGQVRLPFLLLRRLLGRVHGKARPLSGWMENPGAPGNRLYVNRGIGFSRLPLRFNAPPELTFVTLRRAS